MIDVHQYEIEKGRSFKKGEWGLWEYSAFETTSNKFVDPSDKSIDGLAKELANLTLAETTVFSPSIRKHHNPRGVVTKDSVSQTGTVSDDEIAELSLLYQRYSKEK